MQEVACSIPGRVIHNTFKMVEMGPQESKSLAHMVAGLALRLTGWTSITGNLPRKPHDISENVLKAAINIKQLIIYLRQSRVIHFSLDFLIIITLYWKRGLDSTCIFFKHSIECGQSARPLKVLPVLWFISQTIQKQNCWLQICWVGHGGTQ